LPDIVYDASSTRTRPSTGKLPPEFGDPHSQYGDADFGEFRFWLTSTRAIPGIKKGTISKDLKPYEGDGEIPKLNPVTMPA